jgi:hypothetical protein
VGGVAAPAQWQATGARRGRYKKGAGRGGSHDEDDDDISTCSGMSRSATTEGGASTVVRGHITRFCPEKGEKALMADVEEAALL